MHLDLWKRAIESELSYYLYVDCNIDANTSPDILIICLLYNGKVSEF
jgi:hypothetical protein